MEKEMMLCISRDGGLSPRLHQPPLQMANVPVGSYHADFLFLQLPALAVVNRLDELLIMTAVRRPNQRSCSEGISFSHFEEPWSPSASLVAMSRR